MGCCGQQRRRFLTNVKKVKLVDNKPLIERDDSELTAKQIRIKNRIKRIANRNERIAKRIARQDRKNIDN